MLSWSAKRLCANLIQVQNLPVFLHHQLQVVQLNKAVNF
jgi:hypothetical protein